MTDEEFKTKHADNPILSKIEDLKQSDIINVLNASYIAKRFFGKSQGWFSQKLNGHINNGKPAKFSDEEITTLRNALYTLSLELQEIADELQ